MTAVNWWLHPRGAVVMTDSLLTCSPVAGEAPERIPAAFVQKVHPLAHLDAMISGRGDSDLIGAWASLAANRVLAWDFDVLCDLAPRLIRETVVECDQRRGGSYDGTTSIFAWGWSPRAGRVVGFTYRSGSDFEPEPMSDGVMIAPTIDPARSDLRAAFHGDDVPGAMLAVVKQQHTEARAGLVEPGQQGGIGGDVMLTILSLDDANVVQISATRLFRFDDYASDYLAARSRL